MHRKGYPGSPERMARARGDYHDGEREALKPSRRFSYHERGGREVVELGGRFYDVKGDQIAPTEIERDTSPNYIVGYPGHEGIDISRMTCDQIAAAQRSLSPKFPTLAEAAERRRQRRYRRIACGGFALASVCGVLAFGVGMSDPMWPLVGVGLGTIAGLLALWVNGPRVP